MIHVLFPQWSVHSTSTVFTQLLTVQICKPDDFRIQQSGQLNTRSVISGFSQNIGSTIQICIDELPSADLYKPRFILLPEKLYF